MADGLSKAELNHILSNREPYADATDLIAIRDERTAIAARLAELTATRLTRVIRRTEIATLNGRDGLLSTAEINAREHVRASPVKSKVFASEMQLRADAARQSQARQEARAKPGFDKAAFIQRHKSWRADHSREAELAAGIDDDE